MYPHPLVLGGGGILARGRRGGGSQFVQGDRHCGNLGINVLCEEDKTGFEIEGKELNDQ